MPNKATDIVTKERGHGECCCWWRFAIVYVAIVLAPGCGLNESDSLSDATVEFISGKDSAGATVELEKRGTEFTRARVIDVVLGTAEAVILLDDEDRIAFTIDFPTGASLTYVGTIQEMDGSSTQFVAGIWTQNDEGIFGADSGTWEVTFRLPQAAGR